MGNAVRFVFLALLWSACHVPAAMAQQTADGHGDTQPAAPPKPASDNKPYVIALPVVFYTPETKLALGAGGVLGFRLGANRDDTRPSSLPFVVVYTLNKQTQILLKPDIYLPGNTYLVTGTVQFERMPQRFYGVGRTASDATLEQYTPQTIELQIGVKKRIAGHLWAGVQYQFQHTTMRQIDPGGQLAGGEVIGSRGGQISGLGASVLFDSRDNVLFPRHGRYVKVAADRYAPLFGSAFAYTSVEVDMRAYRPVRTADVIAGQVFLKTRNGATPFYELPSLGGDSTMRGYYRGRYRDAAIVTAQAEYRAHIWKRLSAAAFAGMGEACPGLSRCSARGVLPSFGGGLRIKLDPKGGTNLRIEYAAGRNSKAFYMTVQEAF